MELDLRTDLAISRRFLPSSSSGLQLWQYLLDLLSDPAMRDVITWQGGGGLFRELSQHNESSYPIRSNFDKYQSRSKVQIK